VFRAFRELAMFVPALVTAGSSPRFLVVFLAALAKLLVTGLIAFPTFVKLLLIAVLTDFTALLAAIMALFAAIETFFPTFLAALFTALKAFGRRAPVSLFRVPKDAIFGWEIDNAFLFILSTVILINISIR
jgi:hypothetical protein